jgi:hypothetical protein
MCAKRLLRRSIPVVANGEYRERLVCGNPELWRKKSGGDVIDSGLFVELQRQSRAANVPQIAKYRPPCDPAFLGQRLNVVA